MMIPAGKAGLVIGKGGETIKQLQVQCKAVIHCMRYVSKQVNNSNV